MLVAEILKKILNIFGLKKKIKRYKIFEYKDSIIYKQSICYLISVNVTYYK